jgi:hypothetical protein
LSRPDFIGIRWNIHHSMQHTSHLPTMSHLREFQSNAKAPDNRTLGDEWINWDGRDEGCIRVGKWPFLVTCAMVVALADVLLCLTIYMITPRLASWHRWLPTAALVAGGAYIAVTVVWLAQLVFTATTERSAFLFRNRIFFILDIILESVFRLAKMVGISRDRMGASFVRVSNSISRAVKENRGEEKLLLLLPRCLTKEQLRKINGLKEIYPLHIHTVSGGELARRKVKELKPTAVIGVACERDLVSGIRDVAGKISVIGIANQRPEGPCKNTYVDMDELTRAIEFYVGPPRPSNTEPIKDTNQ